MQAGRFITQPDPVGLVGTLSRIALWSPREIFCHAVPSTKANRCGGSVYLTGLIRKKRKLYVFPHHDWHQ